MKNNFFFLKNYQSLDNEFFVFFNLKIKKKDIFFLIYCFFCQKVKSYYFKGDLKNAKKYLDLFLKKSQKFFIFYCFKDNVFSFYYEFSDKNYQNKANILTNLKLLFYQFNIYSFQNIYFIYEKSIILKKQNKLFYQEINNFFASLENKKNKFCLGFNLSKDIDKKFLSYKNDLLQITYKKLCLSNFVFWKANFQIFKDKKNLKLKPKVLNQIFLKKLLPFYKKDQIYSFKKLAFSLLKHANKYFSLGKYSLGFDSKYYFYFFKNPINKIYNPDNFLKTIKYFQNCNPYKDKINYKIIINFQKKFRSVQKKLYYHFLLKNKKNFFKFLKKYYLGYNSSNFYSLNFSKNNKNFCILNLKKEFDYFEKIDPYEEKISYYYISQFFKSSFIINFRNHQLTLFKKHQNNAKKYWKKIGKSKEYLGFNSKNCNYFFKNFSFDYLNVWKKLNEFEELDPFVKNYSKSDLDKLFSIKFINNFYFHQKNAYYYFLNSQKNKYYNYFLGYQKWHDPLKKFKINFDFQNFDLAEIIYLFINLSKNAHSFNYLTENYEFSFIFKKYFLNNFYCFQKKYQKIYQKTLIKFFQEPSEYNYLFTEKCKEIQKIFNVNYSSKRIIKFLKNKKIKNYWLSKFDPFMQGSIFLDFFNLQLKYLKYFLFYIINWFNHYQKFQFYNSYKKKIDHIFFLIKTKNYHELKKYNYYFLKKNYVFFEKNKHLTFFSESSPDYLIKLYYPENNHVFDYYYFKKYKVNSFFVPSSIKNLLLNKKNKDFFNLYQKDSKNYFKFLALQYKIQALYLNEITSLYKFGKNYQGYGIFSVDKIFLKKIKNFFYFFPLTKDQFFELKKYCYLNTYFIYYLFLSKRVVINKYLLVKKIFIYDEKNLFYINNFGNFITYKPLNLNFSEWNLLDENSLLHLNYFYQTYKLFLKEQKSILKIYKKITEKEKSMFTMFLFIFFKEKIFDFNFFKLKKLTTNIFLNKMDFFSFSLNEKKYLVFLPKFLFLLIFEVTASIIDFAKISNFKKLIYIDFLNNKLISTANFSFTNNKIIFLDNDDLYEIDANKIILKNYFSFIDLNLFLKIKKNNKNYGTYFLIKKEKNKHFFNYFVNYRSAENNFYKNYKILGYISSNSFFLLKNKKSTVFYSFDFEKMNLKKHSYFEILKKYQKLLKKKNFFKRIIYKKKLKKINLFE